MMFGLTQLLSLLLVGASSVSCAKTTSLPHTTPLDLDHFFRTIFQQFDLNHDSQITFLEFEQLWKRLDVNGDNSVTTEEYSSITHYSKFVVTEIYKYLDHDHNNRINLQETPRIFLEYDTNADGVIHVQEFVNEYWRIYNFVKADITSESDERLL